MKDGSLSLNMMIQELKLLKVEEPEDSRLQDLEKVAKFINPQKIKNFWQSAKFD